MLSLRILRRRITFYFKPSTQQLHTSMKLLSAVDSSSSSSSDSDSDEENKNIKKPIKTQSKDSSDENLNIPDTNERLNALLLKISQASRDSIKNQMSETKTKSEYIINKNDEKFQVAIKPKNIRLKNIEKSVKEKPYAQKLITAAQDVAKTFKGDPQKTETELLSQVLNLENSNINKDKNSSTEEIYKTPIDLSDLLKTMKIQTSTEAVSKTRINEREKAMKNLKQRFKEPSVAESLLSTKAKRKSARFVNKDVDTTELNSVNQSLGILKNLDVQQIKENLELLTWTEMEAREIKLAFLTAPQNIFEELILWTEQGKLWHFPINNEQGMEEEEKVHFSEHVFMERHIKDWCPKRGPIRHFMELVCVGLSKNPYMSVEEKIGHITWYKNYFENKKDLLHELDILDDKSASTLQSEDKRQIEA